MRTPREGIGCAPPVVAGWPGRTLAESDADPPHAARLHMNDRARNRSEGPPGRSGRLHRLRAEALAFEHPDASLAGAFDAARERAIAPVRDEQGAAPPTRVVAFEQAALSAFAALVIGDHDLARTRIAAIAGERAGLLTAWLIGRYYGYTGDPQAASWLRPAA